MGRPDIFFYAAVYHPSASLMHVCKPICHVDMRKMQKALNRMDSLGLVRDGEKSKIRHLRNTLRTLFF